MQIMDLFLVSLLSLVSFIVIFKLLIPKKGKNLAPSPPSLPIIGHLHLIGERLHRPLQHLSSKYGPIMALRFGSRPVLVITSPSAVEECFTKNNDIILANRPLVLSGKYLDYDHTALGSVPYGSLWRDHRRIITLEFFSTSRLKAYMGVRQDEMRSFIKSLSQDTWQENFTRVEMKSRLEGLSFNIITRMLADKRYYGTGVDNFDEAANFKRVMWEVFDITGSSNPGDCIPFLQWIDFQGFEKKVKKLHNTVDRFSQNLIEECRSERRSSSGKGKAKTFIDAMLCLQESDPEYYTDNIIKGHILSLLLAGTSAVSVTIEWAMSVLLNHPDVLKRSQAEVDEHIGHQRLVEETDIPKLPYIQCVVNETLRLFPEGPLLLPHEASEDCTIGGFDVSRGTMVLVNAWAIQRDPLFWDDPLSFKPERFEKMGKMGSWFIPFGMGRRQCPGVGLGNRAVILALASLIQCFEWERVGEELVDLMEDKGTSFSKDIPLEAMCRTRQRMNHILKEL